MPPIDADQFENEMNTAKTADVQANAALKAKREEGRSLSRQVIFALLRTLVRDDTLTNSIRLVKKRRSRRWVFEVSFPESQLINLPEVNQALDKVRKIWGATGLNDQPPVSEDSE